jgi:hypothetical protein
MTPKPGAKRAPKLVRGDRLTSRQLRQVQAVYRQAADPAWVRAHAFYFASRWLSRRYGPVGAQGGRDGQ